MTGIFGTRTLRQMARPCLLALCLVLGGCAAIEKAVTGLGGRLEAFYFAFGGVDAFVIVDLPDNVTAAAMGLAVGQSGLASTKTVVLLTPEEVDAATKKSVPYRGPGH